MTFHGQVFVPGVTFLAPAAERRMGQAPHRQAGAGSAEFPFKELELRAAAPGSAAVEHGSH